MKKLFVIVLLCLPFFSVSAKDLDSTALILIDIQEFYFPGGAVELYQPLEAAEKAAGLLSYFRENNGLVVHVRHNFEPGGTIHKSVAPLPNEKIISKDEVSAFLGTDLHEFLQSKQIKKVVLCGMQTHMCLEGATRAAHDLGYNCTVIGDACTTRDLKYNDTIIKAKDVHFSTLSTLKAYANVLPLKDYLPEPPEN